MSSGLCYNARRLVGVLFFAWAALSFADARPEPSASLLLPDVPFHPQEDFQCGPAALAMLLNHAGIAVTPEQLQPQVYLPAREGSLTAEMLAATRRQQRIPYLVPGNLDAMLRELADGYPLLVLLNLGLSWWPRWHYAVLIGHDADRRELILHSGRERASRMQLTPFLNSWQRGGNWAMLASQPARLPRSADPGWVLQQGIALEQAGQDRVAAELYQAAVDRWPDVAELWFGLGNVAYRQALLQKAEFAWQQALQHKPASVPARLNLIELLLEQGRAEDARRLVQQGLQLEPRRAEYLQLQQRLQP